MLSGGWGEMLVKEEEERCKIILFCPEPPNWGPALLPMLASSQMTIR